MSGIVQRALPSGNRILGPSESVQTLDECLGAYHRRIDEDENKTSPSLEEDIADAGIRE